MSLVDVVPLSKLLSAAGAPRAGAASASVGGPGTTAVAGGGGATAARAMMVAMPYRSRRLLAGLESAAHGRWLGASTGGEAGLRALTVSSEPGAVLLASVLQGSSRLFLLELPSLTTVEYPSTGPIGPGWCWGASVRLPLWWTSFSATSCTSFDLVC